MKHSNLTSFLLCTLLVSTLTVSEAKASTDVMDLSGSWGFVLDPMNMGKELGCELYGAVFNDSIQLPGTTDEGLKGSVSTFNYVDRLNRKYEFCGQAWYQREVIIPENWADKEITLFLERCHWITTVYVDGREVGKDEHLSMPNRFVLSPYLKPGSHLLTICIDNRDKYGIGNWAHSFTEFTQTNWNGVVGRMELIADGQQHILSVNTYPDLAHQQVRVSVNVKNVSESPCPATLRLQLREKDGKIIGERTQQLNIQGMLAVTDSILLGKKMKLWDEFNPNLYELTTTLDIDGQQSVRTTTFGMREVSQGTHHIMLNGHDIHLRGTLDCCHFPLTGYPSTKVEDWQKIMAIVKSYGLNHVRFHSWCPPEAAFVAADEAGIYLQIEGPIWTADIGTRPDREAFFEKEIIDLLDEYGNHPSFILFCNGNELGGDFNILESYIKKAQAHDCRHLYSASTARTHTPSDQFYVSHMTEKGWCTIYEGKPSTDRDLNAESDIDCPVIAHELGQRCMYPNFKEMPKYTGVLEPRNMATFRNRLEEKGMLNQADAFLRATGAHTVLQYKEDFECMLRSSRSAGFQWLSLTDFPGQGSAYVGILDNFWDSKNLVTPEQFCTWCGPTVLLNRMSKRTYTNQEHYTPKLELYNYSNQPIRSGKLLWELIDQNGRILRKGFFRTHAVDTYLVDSLGTIDIDLSIVKKASQLTFRAAINGSYQNEWNIWVYPEMEASLEDNIVYAKQYDESVRKALAEGKTVFLNPQKVHGRKTQFAGFFWNPIMFKSAPYIVGTLIDDNSPALADFPTSYYADWQWWDILNYATAMELDGFTQIKPIIQSVDTYEHNAKLGIAFEARVANGKIFVLSVDAETDLDERPAMRQLLYSINEYIKSERFQPTCGLKEQQLERLFE